MEQFHLARSICHPLRGDPPATESTCQADLSTPPPPPLTADWLSPGQTGGLHPECGADPAQAELTTCQASLTSSAILFASTHRHRLNRKLRKSLSNRRFQKLLLTSSNRQPQPTIFRLTLLTVLSNCSPATLARPPPIPNVNSKNQVLLIENV